MIKGKIYVHPLGERLFHWGHALLMVILIYTGACILFKTPFLLPFKIIIPLHKIAGLILGIEFLGWITYGIVTGRIKGWFPKGKEWTEGIPKQIRWYAWGIFKGEPHPCIPSPENRLNPLQKISYAIIMLVLLPLQGLTGIIMLFPHKFLWLLRVINYSLLDRIHVILFYLFSMFVLLHLYLETTGFTLTSCLIAMLKGYIKEEDINHAILNQKT